MAEKIRVKRNSRGQVEEVEYLDKKDVEAEGCGGCLLIIIVGFIILFFLKSC